MPLPRWAELSLPLVAPTLIRLLHHTWRVRVTGFDAAFEGLSSGLVIALWHGRQLAITPVAKVALSHAPAVVMTSSSRDGRVQAKILRGLGFDTVTGSSSHRGSAALIDLARRVRQGHTAVVAADGPVGPVFCAKSGVVVLSRMTNAPIVPVGVVAPAAFVIPRTWDEFVVPLPGASVAVRFGSPIDPPGSGRAALADTHDELQRALAALNETSPRSLRR